MVLCVAEHGADLVNTGGEPGKVQRCVEELRRRRLGEGGSGR